MHSKSTLFQIPSTISMKNFLKHTASRVERITLAMSLIISFTTSSAMAQKQTTRKKTTTSTSVSHQQSAEQLIQSYRFSEAARLLQKEIDVARSSGRSTLRIEADLQRANLGIDMLRGTERVCFVDSIVVSRTKMLSKLNLSVNAGKIVNLKDVMSSETLASGQYGQAGYINELRDRIIFSKSDSAGCASNLHIAYHVGNGWSAPTPLNGMHDISSEQDFPFLMPDGVTLYYAAQGAESLGGYDLFVTRYNPETKQYLKAENLGMPFNSPANDYLLAIDERVQLGFLVTDRNQPADSVCIYTFIPNSTRDIYEMSDANKIKVMHAAMLHSISETQTDEKIVAAARERLTNLLAHRTTDNVRTQGQHFYVINNEIVYTQLSQFRSETAKRIAQQADETQQKLQQLQNLQDQLQRKAAQQGLSSQERKELIQANQTIPSLQAQYEILCKNMRQAEIK